MFLDIKSPYLRRPLRSYLTHPPDHISYAKIEFVIVQPSTSDIPMGMLEKVTQLKKMSVTPHFARHSNIETQELNSHPGFFYFYFAPKKSPILPGRHALGVKGVKVLQGLDCHWGATGAQGLDSHWGRA